MRIGILGSGLMGGKVVAAELIRDASFDPVHAGPLRIARYAEPSALLVAQLAYEGEGCPELAYRFERFNEGIQTLSYRGILPTVAGASRSRPARAGCPRHSGRDARATTIIRHSIS